MSVTNLTGTTWRFGEYLVTDYTDSFEYNISTTYNIVCDNPYTNTFDSIRLVERDDNYYVFATYVTNYTCSAIYHGYRSTPQIMSNRREGFQYVEVTFGEGADSTNATLIAWLEANGVLIGGEYDAPEEPESPEELPGGTTITYDGGTIAAVVSGGIATLKCAGLKMKTDITVTAGSGSKARPKYDGKVEVIE